MTLAAMPMMSMLVVIPKALMPVMSMEQQKSSSAYPILKFRGSFVSDFEITSINAWSQKSSPRALVCFAKWFPVTCLRSLPNLAGWYGMQCLSSFLAIGNGCIKPMYVHTLLLPVTHQLLLSVGTGRLG